MGVAIGTSTGQRPNRDCPSPRTNHILSRVCGSPTRAKKRKNKVSWLPRLLGEVRKNKKKSIPVVRHYVGLPTWYGFYARERQPILGCLHEGTPSPRATNLSTTSFGVATSVQPGHNLGRRYFYVPQRGIDREESKGCVCVCVWVVGFWCRTRVPTQTPPRQPTCETQQHNFQPSWG